MSDDDLSEAVSMRPSLDNSFDKDPVPVHASYNFNDVSCNFISATKSHDNAYSFLEPEENTLIAMHSSHNSQHLKDYDQDNNNEQALFNLSQEAYSSNDSSTGGSNYSKNQKHAECTVAFSDNITSSNDSSLSVESSQSTNSSANTTPDQSASSIPEQASSNSTLDLGLNCKGFRMGHMNIQGISNKIDQVRMLLDSSKNDVHIFGLSETKLHAVHPDSAFMIDGYQKPFRKDCEVNMGGGLLVYVKEGVCCNRRSDLEKENLECVWLEIKPVKSKPFLVGNIYRPPNSNIQWSEIFEDCIEHVLQEEKEIYLMGDINRDLLNDNIRKAWTDYMEPFGLIQLISEATRVTPLSKTLIDHIYTNCPENVNSINVPQIGLSDHFPIFFTRKMHIQPPKRNHFTISYRSFRGFDEVKFMDDLQNVPWNTIKLFDDTDDILDAWLDLFLQVVDKHVPIKHQRVKRINQPRWISPEILDAIKSRDRHKSLGNMDEYRFWRNKVIKLIKYAKKDQYQTFIENNKDKPGSIYKIFKEVGAGKGPQKQINIGSVSNENTHTEHPTEIANIFNDFFVNIANKVKEPVTNTNHEKLRQFCQSKLPTNTKFVIPNIEREKVMKFLSNIDTTKSTGTDNIGPRLLKLAAPHIVDDITFICNHSIKNSVFPSKWKEAKVVPLRKNGPQEEVNNYRPISILPVMSKILEKHVHDSLYSFLHEFDLLHKTQSGFRSQHSCETALIHMIDNWLNAIDNGKMIGIVLVDFKKAFDLVDHKILLSKLKIYGIKDETLSWFDNYLSQRRQQVSINNAKSEFKQVTYGVPQGSILGPLLFLLFINDLPLYTSNVNTDLYADDTTLYAIQDSLEIIENNLDSALNNLHIWCKCNGMLLNSAKTKVMLVTTNQKRKRINTDKLNLIYNDESLSMTTSDKILGVCVDNNLNWTEHVKSLTKKYCFKYMAAFKN